MLTTLLNEETGRIAFSAEELVGVPADVVSGYTKLENGDLELTFKITDLGPPVRHTTDPSTRYSRLKSCRCRTPAIPRRDAKPGMRVLDAFPRTLRSSTR